jgi:hypothetical protein
MRQNEVLRSSATSSSALHNHQHRGMMMHSRTVGSNEIRNNNNSNTDSTSTGFTPGYFANHGDGGHHHHQMTMLLTDSSSGHHQEQQQQNYSSSSRNDDYDANTGDDDVENVNVVPRQLFRSSSNSSGNDDVCDNASGKAVDGDSYSCTQICVDPAQFENDNNEDEHQAALDGNDDRSRYLSRDNTDTLINDYDGSDDDNSSNDDGVADNNHHQISSAGAGAMDGTQEENEGEDFDDQDQVVNGDGAIGGDGGELNPTADDDNNNFSGGVGDNDHDCLLNGFGNGDDDDFDLDLNDLADCGDLEKLMMNDNDDDDLGDMMISSQDLANM